MPTRLQLDACTAILPEVMRWQQPADAVLAQRMREQRALGARDRRVVSDAVFSVLRQRTRFEAWVKLGPKAGAASDSWRLLALLGLADDHQRRDDLVPLVSEQEAAWLQACAAEPAGDWLDPRTHNLPVWLAQALTQLDPPQGFPALAQALQQPAPLDLRVNTLKVGRKEVRRALEAAGVPCEDTPWSPWGLRVTQRRSFRDHPLWREGKVEWQDEGSQLLARLVDARRGETVVDMCAGAGGKTLALGSAMRGEGHLFALDVSASRLEALRPRLQRSGLGMVQTMALAHARDARLDRLVGKAHRVLVDAPCSGLGTLRRHPDLKWRQARTDIAGFAEQQLDILQAAARLVRPGGRLVYATCSLLREENEDVAAAFEEGQPAFQPVARAGWTLPAGLWQADVGAAQHTLRLWPQVHATDGFFAAVWQRGA